MKGTVRGTNPSSTPWLCLKSHSFLAPRYQLRTHCVLQGEHQYHKLSACCTFVVQYCHCVIGNSTPTAEVLGVHQTKASVHSSAHP